MKKYKEIKIKKKFAYSVSEEAIQSVPVHHLLTQILLKERLGLNTVNVCDSKFHLPVQGSSVVIRANAHDEVKRLIESNFKQEILLFPDLRKKTAHIGCIIGL